VSAAAAGDKLSPRLLSEIGSDREQYPEAQNLQCLAGRASVSYQSGQILPAQIRWRCNRHLRYAAHPWADYSRKVCARAQTYYRIQRERGKRHTRALRCLGQRWLKILWRMWHNWRSHDENLHARNQQRRGSWVLQLQPKQALLPFE